MIRDIHPGRFPPGKRFVIHSAADPRLLDCSAATAGDALDRVLQAQGPLWPPIRWETYEDEGSRCGWFIEAIDPDEREFLPGLRPIGYRSRQLDSTNDADTDGA